MSSLKEFKQEQMEKDPEFAREYRILEAKRRSADNPYPKPNQEPESHSCSVAWSTTGCKNKENNALNADKGGRN